MKAYVINLDSRPDRMEKFTQNIFPFEVKRFPAITASCGEDGCTFSHLAVLREVGNDLNNYPFVVFEDDCVLIEPWCKVEKAISQLPNYWDALWLGANPKQKLKRHSENTFQLKNAWCLHAVIYNNPFMVEYILNYHNTPAGKNLDIFYCKNLMEKFNCFITYPIMATQLSDKSDIAPCITNNYDEIISNYRKATNGK
jgi:GR25 family glycosyltransferase involved in LPS biosynthesis